MYRFHSDNFHWLGFLKPDWKFCWEVSHKKNVHTMICLVEDPYQKHSLFMVISSGFLLPTKQYENEEWQQGSLSWQLSKKRIICLTRLLLQIVQSPFQTLERRQKQAGGSQLSGQTVFLSHSVPFSTWLPNMLEVMCTLGQLWMGTQVGFVVRFWG